MAKVFISAAPLLTLPALNRLFITAVDQHFQYFPQSVRTKVIRDHSVWKLARARLDPKRELLIARKQGKIVGYVIGAAPRTGPAQIYWLYVEPGERGSNIGLSLLSRMLKMLAQKGAKKVSIATYDHRRYYQRQGFKFFKNIVSDGVPMDILTFELDT